MKIITVIAASFLFCFNFLTAQEYVKPKNSIGLSAGLSFMNLSSVQSENNGQVTEGTRTTNIPVFGFFAERRITAKVGLGMEFTYALNQWFLDEPGIGGMEISYSRIRILPIINIHFAEYQKENVVHDFYSSFGLGVKLASFDINYVGPNFGRSQIEDGIPIFEFPLAMKTGIGYSISSHNGLMGKVELSLGGPFFVIGGGYEF